MEIERFPDDFMFQLTKGELDILKSQFVISKMTEIQVDENLISQNATSNIHDSESVGALTSQNVILKNGRGQHSKYLPYVFTEQGVAMLSSVLRSPLAIQVNIGIIRAFVEIRRMTTSLVLPNSSADVVQLRKDFEDLKLDIEDILHDQNDINESTRFQLDAISTALAALGFAACYQRDARTSGRASPTA